MIITIIGLSSLAVGVLIGISGIAGFLLPITFGGFLGLPLADSLALAFLAFLTSGILGAWSYKKEGHLDMQLALPLCAGSVLGALGGVWLNTLIPVDIAKVLLYTVVLASGISILVKKDRQDPGKDRSPLTASKPFLLLMGAVTAAICSLTGAGGPILVVPLLALLGVDLRAAVGISLLDSVAIALPACVGYMGQVQGKNFLLLATVCVATHAVGVLVGAKVAGKVNLKLLKWMVAALAIGASCYMLLKMVL